MNRFVPYKNHSKNHPTLTLSFVWINKVFGKGAGQREVRTFRALESEQSETVLKIAVIVTYFSARLRVSIRIEDFEAF